MDDSAFAAGGGAVWLWCLYGKPASGVSFCWVVLCVAGVPEPGQERLHEGTGGGPFPGPGKRSPDDSPVCGPCA